MRTTIAIDRNLLARVQAYTGLTDESAIVHEALKALVQREAARRLASLGGSQPDVEGARRGPPEGHEDLDAR
ncbi:type II toxin-antitoxin system VapB family antitoxin [Caballeronia sp. SL2Y3]|uniref:type II toxin-antitoxin system VapB family antitoxin n=1 Tax=Caballeronia sp. SL2Y3 TaxID=2878151 RepID=UPI001FD5BCD8|nr:type II toxin-antitoxin system VapB family antitoxin [Caballeronia sp. SL2Y3]